MNMASIAPGSVKLFGEHAVIYDRVGVSASFGRYATVRIVPADSGKIEISLPDLGLYETFTEQNIKELHNSVDLAVSSKNHKRLHDLRQGSFALPFLYILGTAFVQKGFKPIRVDVRSEVPRRSGLGSSSSIFAALAEELSAHFKMGLSKQGVAELANLGDIVVHGSPSGIDVNTCVHGGILRFRKKEGIAPLISGKQVPVLIINTNVAKDTGEMIARVAKQYAEDKTGTDRIFDDMQEAAFAGIDALKNSDMVSLGAELGRAEKCFERLGLNTRETDDIITVAKKYGAYGAKISGAGGGGCVLAVAEEPAKLAPLFVKMGYPAFETKLGVEGVSHKEFV